ncbi:MAG: septum formation protein Maf [Flavobacteriales bacterium]|nr:septum formation protein Maf [Flavobacteriales bacterium]MBK6945824.1 septum formation protein Maf [Flavobacteriales bacterium]MBK7241924.1 septum formation protein Maf [Flavobacteriales bacterium]MBK7298830.1 septum formation protein Maf [Flavobacteriales bacterium]MBK9534625.1 septum formation protein Maf [Flavobacteriales bacterium]
MNLRLILASASPRRRQLLQGLDLPVEITSVDVDETPPEGLPNDHVAEYLARKKANAWKGQLAPDQVLVTADTTVVIGDVLLNKPEDAADARRMLAMLSGRTHRVITGVCLRTAEKTVSFSDIAHVTFGQLTPEEIAYYVERYSPLDKAGAYGVQDWIGYVAVERIDGSFYTVMGLPLHLIYAELTKIMR